MTASTIESTPSGVWLYRHGPLDIPRYQCVGWSDVPLGNPEQTANEARTLAAYIGKPTALFSSDLLRTRQTAAPLAEALGMEVTLEPSLRELNFGEWEGRMWNDLGESGDDRFRAFVQDWRSTNAPGGESFRDVERRVSAFWAQAAARHAGEEIVVVSHGGSLVAFSILLFGWSHEYAMKHMLERGHFGYIDFRRGGHVWNFDPARLPARA
ncbi:MAG: histidine phosphatase family protein [Candidatus Lernaella stagnicola]|nr:histidine phosphatase family protein [Candidatus Lernaella stagnicola]